MREAKPKPPVISIITAHAIAAKEQPPVISDFFTVLKPRSLMAPNVTAESSAPRAANIQKETVYSPLENITPKQ